MTWRWLCFKNLLSEMVPCISIFVIESIYDLLSRTNNLTNIYYIYQPTQPFFTQTLSYKL